MFKDIHIFIKYWYIDIDSWILTFERGASKKKYDLYFSSLCAFFVAGCCFVTFYTRKAALDAQNALHNVKTFSGVS